MLDATHVLQRLLTILDEGMKEYVMKINLGKANVMKVNNRGLAVRISEGIEKINKYRKFFLCNDKEAFFSKRRKLLCSKRIKEEVSQMLYVESPFKEVKHGQ